MTVCYENETYSVEEEAGVVTLALVLEGDAAIPVTVSVITRNLTNSSVGDAATSELLKSICMPHSLLGGISIITRAYIQNASSLTGQNVECAWEHEELRRGKEHCEKYTSYVADEQQLSLRVLLLTTRSKH